MTWSHVVNDIVPIANLVISSGALVIGVKFIFFMGKMTERFDQVGKQVHRLEHKVFGEVFGD